jgi:5-methylcytosine-specific restriction endonuclease McrA
MPPPYLSMCDPTARVFPLDWKVAFYRLNGGSESGYACPRCKTIFLGPNDFEELHGDHVLPVKAGGLTIWKNLQLLCGPCNLTKGSTNVAYD